MRLKIIGFVAVAALAVLAFQLAPASPVSAQTTPGSSAPGTPASVPLNFGLTTPAPAVAAPGVSSAPAPASVPSGCALYDSWCAYCTAHAGSDLCPSLKTSPAGSDVVGMPQDVQPDTGAALTAAPGAGAATQ